MGINQFHKHLNKYAVALRWEEGSWMDKVIRMFRLRGLQCGVNSRIIRKILALN
jgi:hypothetical protein